MARTNAQLFISHHCRRSTIATRNKTSSLQYAASSTEYVNKKSYNLNRVNKHRRVATQAEVTLLLFFFKQLYHKLFVDVNFLVVILSHVPVVAFAIAALPHTYNYVTIFFFASRQSGTEAPGFPNLISYYFVIFQELYSYRF